MTLRSTVHRRHDRPNPRRIGLDPAVLVRRGVLAQEDTGPLEGHGAPGGPAPADVDLAHTGLPHDPRGVTLVDPASREDGDPPRSEEHTSELQSRFGISYAVFCLNKNNEVIDVIAVLGRAVLEIILNTGERY